MLTTATSQPIQVSECLFEKMIKCISSKAKITAKIYTQVNAVPFEWNNLAQSVLLKREVLEVTEKSNIDDFNYYYACFYKEEQLIGIAYFQLIQVNSKHYSNFGGTDVVSKRIYSYISKRSYPMLVAGHLFLNNFKSYSLKSEIPILDFSKAYFTILTAIQKHSKAKIVLMKEFEGELSKKSLKNGFIAMSEDYFMQMSLPKEWKSIEDYLGALSKKYLARAKKIITQAQSLDIRELNENQIKEHIHTIEKLYLNVTQKATVKLGILNGEFFYELKKAIPSNFRFYAYFLDDELIAFSTGLITENTYETYYIGADEEKCKDLGIYQQLLIMGVEKAIENQKSILALGRTALEAKAIIGCKPRLVPNYIKFSNRLLQLGASFVISNFYKHNGTEWEKRNPFK